MRRAARTDSNQTEIVAILRSLGCSVQMLHAVGAGCPDLLVGVAGQNLLIEIKDGSRKPSARRLTSDQGVWGAVER
jgi:Holliday junction resolvase